jgi:hypothetical protein
MRRRLDICIRVRTVGIALLMVSAICPWLMLRGRAGGTHFSLLDLPFTRVAFIIVISVIVVLTILEVASAWVGVATSLVAALSLLLLIWLLVTQVLIELTAILVFPRYLPSTLRRLSIGIEPLYGLLVAIVGAALIIISSVVTAEKLDNWFGNLKAGYGERDPAIAALPISIIGVVLLIIGRDSNWIQLRATNGSAVWDLPGWAIPWMGLATLLLLLLAVAGVAAFCLRRSILCGVVLMTVGWAVTLPYALIMVVVRAIPHITAPSWLKSHLSEWATTAHAARYVGRIVPDVPHHLTVALGVGVGAILVFIAGVSIALAGLLMCLSLTNRARVS